MCAILGQTRATVNLYAGGSRTKRVQPCLAPTTDPAETPAEKETIGRTAGGMYASFSWDTDQVGVESRSGATVFQCACSDFVARAFTESP